MQYEVIIEAGPRNYSGYAPAVPGCAATGDTAEECRRNLREALEFHLEGLREDGLPIPVPDTVEVSVPA